MPSPSLSRVAAPSPRLLRFLKQQNNVLGIRIELSGSASCVGRARRTRLLSTSCREIKLLPAPRCNGPRCFENPSAQSNLPAESHWPNGTLGSCSGLYGSPSHHRRRSFGDGNRPSLRRLFSSSSFKNIWNILGLGGAKAQTSTATSTLPALASFLDDNSSPGRILKPSTEPCLRCTEFDEHGNVTVVNGEFKKTELIAKYGLLPRDLRKIDSSMLPSILVRPSAILINLLHLRVLIKSDRVLVFDAYGSTDSYTQSVFMYDLEGKLRSQDTRSNGALPYEFRALEAVLISVTTSLESEFEGVRDPVVKVLRELEEDIDRDKLRYLLIYSKKLGTFEQKARLVRDALDELLEADDDLAAMYLSEKAQGRERAEDDHAEVELLLESYHKVADEIVQAAENLVSNIRNTEEIVRAILDANRNSLMLLELRFSIFTLGLGAGTFIAALYGMNLKNFMEESGLGFWGVSGISAAFAIVVLTYGLGRLRKVQRVSMWGECPPALTAGKGWSGKWAIKERKMAEWARLRELKEERSSGWGLGRGTAAAGLGSLGGTAEMRRVRQQQQQQQWQRDWQHQARLAQQQAQQQAHAAKRRKVEAKKGNSHDGGGDGYGNTMSGMGAKPGDGSPALD